ncbi:hypothetical protein Dimus_006257 [Dionaea muscipula]
MGMESQRLDLLGGELSYQCCFSPASTRVVGSVAMKSWSWVVGWGVHLSKNAVTEIMMWDFMDCSIDYDVGFYGLLILLIGCTPLHRAASTGHSNLCDLLIEEGAEIEAVDIVGQTPIMSAVICQHKEWTLILGVGCSRGDFSMFWMAFGASVDSVVL